MKKYLILQVLFVISLIAEAQEPYYTGLILDDEAYEQIQRKPELLTRDYTVLPRSYSLQKYCPEVKSQSQYGTCTSWATAYAARTIIEAVNNGWTSQERITREAFSPIFVYAQIKNEDDLNCQQGSYIGDAFELLKTKGVPKFSLFDVLCANEIGQELFSAASVYKIDDYFTLFSYSCNSYNEKINKTKKAISQNCPVVISMKVYPSFHTAKEAWNGYVAAGEKPGNHAMCVVGYDDDMNGGSFLIMNSWGTYWGNNGFTWVTYQDYFKYVSYAVEMYVRKKAVPTPQPKPQPQPQPVPQPIKKNVMSGSMRLQLSTGENMKVTYDPSYIPHYKANEEYISGTRYRIYVSNGEPAYVYIIGSDLKNSVSKVFPSTDKISPALVYKSSNIAIPDEKWYIEMDDTKGKDYVCVLYSCSPLSINDIIVKIKEGQGSFYDKLKSALSAQLVSSTDVSYGQDEITFCAETEATIIPFIVEITHR